MNDGGYTIPIDAIPHTPWELLMESNAHINRARLKAGDRIRIRYGYIAAGAPAYYVGVSAIAADSIVVEDSPGSGDEYTLLAAAIEPWPTTRDERIEQAIEDYVAVLRMMSGYHRYISDYDRAILHAIIDAGV